MAELRSSEDIHDTLPRDGRSTALAHLGFVRPITATGVSRNGIWRIIHRIVDIPTAASFALAKAENPAHKAQESAYTLA